jgi:hypothetical protein
MYTLKQMYGKRSFDEWRRSHPEDLSDFMTSPSEAYNDLWEVKSYTELVEGVAFLGAMNKRLVLYFRGQTSPLLPIPALFRSSWTCFDTDMRLEINCKNRSEYWKALGEVGEEVYAICKKMGLPRWRGLRDIRESQWAVIQHYGIWPTPLIDLTLSLRVAARFAFPFSAGNPQGGKRGYMFVVGLPDTTGSITFNLDHNLVLARLQSVCPPVAKRPHYQDGFLIGRFPFQSPNDFLSERQREKVSLLPRLIAKFELIDQGNFWNKNFPVMKEEAVYPVDDPLMKQFIATFGRKGPKSVFERASKFSNSFAA